PGDPPTEAACAVTHVEVHSMLDGCADRCAHRPAFVEDTFGARMVDVRDHVAADQESQDLIERNGCLTGVDHDRLTNRVGYLAGPAKHLARMVRISADALLADPDLDPGDDVGERARHGDGAVDVRPTNIF